MSEGGERLAAARRRAAAAKAREIETHQRAILLHEESAIRQEKLGFHAAAELERQRAESVRARLVQALEERDADR